MKFSVGIVIFFLALVALVAELILYFFLGVGAALSGDTSAIGGVAAFFIWLMIMTVIAGIAAPVCGFIENISKKANLGMYIFLSVLGLATVGVGGLTLLSYSSVSKVGTSSTLSSASAAEKSGSNWQVTEDTSKMDGSKTVLLRVSAANEIKGWLKSSRPS